MDSIPPTSDDLNERIAGFEPWLLNAKDRIPANQRHWWIKRHRLIQQVVPLIFDIDVEHGEFHPTHPFTERMEWNADWKNKLYGEDSMVEFLDSLTQNDLFRISQAVARNEPASSMTELTNILNKDRDVPIRNFGPWKAVVPTERTYQDSAEWDSRDSVDSFDSHELDEYLYPEIAAQRQKDALTDIMKEAMGARRSLKDDTYLKEIIMDTLEERGFPDYS